MKLDARLQAIADFIGNSKKILDVGTDHGYLCLYLVENNLVEKGIASDVSKDSLQKAIDLVKNQGMEAKIECRLGSGLGVIDDKDQVDTIIIAGMGGILISEILETDKSLIAETRPKLVLQPVQRPEILRRYLIENGYRITAETLVEAEGKIYNIILSEYAGLSVDYDYRYFEIGKYSKKTKTYYKHLTFLIQKYDKIVQSMKKASVVSWGEVREKEGYLNFLKELGNSETK